MQGSLSGSWCTITKTSNTAARITAQANNYTSPCGYGVVCNSGSNVASISISQLDKSSTVTYDCSKSIQLYSQPTVSICATICVCMCMGVTVQKVKDNCFNIDYIGNWTELASEYGYNCEPISSSEDVTYKKLFDILAVGYPIIVKVNNAGLHWVIVTKYVGDDTSFSVNNFTCADPSDGSFKSLSSATRFSDICKYIVVK